MLCLSRVFLSDPGIPVLAWLVCACVLCFVGALSSTAIFPNSGSRIHSDEGEAYPGAAASQEDIQPPAGRTGESMALASPLSPQYSPLCFILVVLAL